MNDHERYQVITCYPPATRNRCFTAVARTEVGSATPSLSGQKRLRRLTSVNQLTSLFVLVSVRFTLRQHVFILTAKGWNEQVGCFCIFEFVLRSTRFCGAARRRDLYQYIPWGNMSLWVFRRRWMVLETSPCLQLLHL